MRITGTFTFVMVVSAAWDARAIVIDDFKVGPAYLVRDTGVPVALTQTGLDPSHVLGGKRELVLGRFYSNGQSLEIDTTESQMTLAIANPGDLSGLDLTYGSRIEPLGVNLMADGSNRFVFDFDVLPSCCDQLVITSIAAGVLSIDNVQLNDYFDGHTATIPFSQFDGVDLTNVASIELGFFRSRGVVLQSIYTVPEPFCVKQAVFCLATFAFWARKQRLY